MRPVTQRYVVPKLVGKSLVNEYRSWLLTSLLSVTYKGTTSGRGTHYRAPKGGFWAIESHCSSSRRGFLSHRMGFLVSKKGRIWYGNGPVPGCLSAMLVGVVEPFSGTGKGFCTLGDRHSIAKRSSPIWQTIRSGVPGFWRLAREGE